MKGERVARAWRSPGFFLLIPLALSSFAIGAQASVDRSGVTVTDMVRFASFGDPYPVEGAEGKVLSSPDGRLAAVVVRHGDTEKLQNTTDLLIYNYADLRAGRDAPLAKLSLSSMRNFPPLAQLRWIGTSGTLAFVGASGSDPAQVYTFDVHRKKLNAVTHSSSDVRYFDISQDGSRLVITTETVTASGEERQECLIFGCRLDGDTLSRAISGRSDESDVMVSIDLASRRQIAVPSPDSLNTGLYGCRDGRGGGISPDGRYALRLCRRRSNATPDWWGKYTVNPTLSQAIEAGSTGFMRQWVLVDLTNGRSTELGNAPYPTINGGARPIWIEGGRQLLIPGALEPLSDIDDRERLLRASRYSAILFDLHGRGYKRIGHLPAAFARTVFSTWDDQAAELCIQGGDQSGRDLGTQGFEFHRGGWRKAECKIEPAKGARRILSVADSANDPPVLVVDGPDARRVVYDPNPWLTSRKLADTRWIEWPHPLGGRLAGRLYFPVGFKRGVRYPLVIQTHGALRDQYSLTGLSTNYAAQPLAAAGIMVLQIQEQGPSEVGRGEFEQARIGYESAIDYLKNEGLIDGNRVGIVGWSRTGPYVGYTLTRSDYPFASAFFTDTADYGWFYYMINGTKHGEGAYGRAPLGAGLAAWAELAPTFNLDRLRTPVAMWTAGEVPNMWDWYVLLKRYKMPVEYWTFPDGQHEVYKIGERIRTGQLMVDWFSFWLMNVRRTDPLESLNETKENLSDQFKRWDLLREQRDILAALPKPERRKWTVD